MARIGTMVPTLARIKQPITNAHNSQEHITWQKAL